MLRTRRLVGSICLFVLVYGLLTAPWPGVQACYSTAYRAVANSLFGSFGSEGIVRFELRPSQGKWADTSVTIARRGSSEGIVIPHSPRLRGYLPTVELIALILATRVPWSRRWRALMWGLVWVHGYILLKLVIALLHAYDGTDPWCLYALGPFSSKVLHGTYEVFVRSGTTPFLVPVFLWLLVTFRSSDWEQALRTSTRHRPRA